MEPVESSICYETNLSATTMLTFQLKASVPPAEFPSSAMSRGLGAPGCTTSTGLEPTTAVISPLKRNFNLCKRDPQHPFSLCQELSRSHAGRPFALGYSSRYKPNTSSSFPPTLVLKGRNTFLAENCKLSRPTVNYPTYSLLIVKDSQKRPSYPDPMVRASRSFLNRISELSSLEGKTIRQEKRLKTKKTPKPPS